MMNNVTRLLGGMCRFSLAKRLWQSGHDRRKLDAIHDLLPHLFGRARLRATRVLSVLCTVYHNSGLLSSQWWILACLGLINLIN